MLEHRARGQVSVDSSHSPNGWNGPNGRSNGWSLVSFLAAQAEVTQHLGWRALREFIPSCWEEDLSKYTLSSH